MQMEENVQMKDSIEPENKVSTEKIEKEEKMQVNLEVIEDIETTTSQQPVYQIRPQLHDKFKPLNAKEVIHNVLFDQLSAKTYDSGEAVQWTKDIADIIREKVKDLNFKRYKYIVNVVLGEQHGAGVKMGTRCIWDAEADSYAYDSFVNHWIHTMGTTFSGHYILCGYCVCCIFLLEMVCLQMFSDKIRYF
ncbi:dynein light chain Tctex-type protein 2B-like isoform X1 [Hylaeus volcanicus]|uniref:dynein light chain Tctex-type protein 2B-like isoform X1 n=1 Tax=Hylaeus volcanicus TaxID=313075 RepID=UPI0023B7B893|nr:dynein light chain Tctex-type protein 2B-like isoform X1 [Hylaeus volcanicus]